MSSTRRAKFYPEGIGELFKRTPRAIKVYVRGPYNGKTYDCDDYYDQWNQTYSFKGTTKVYAGFTY